MFEAAVMMVGTVLVVSLMFAAWRGLPAGNPYYV
jgi:hypothetical protein